MSEFEASIKAMIDDAVRAAFQRLGAPTSDELLSTVEAAKHAKVVPATIRRWVAKGKLREYHAGRELRISRADLDRMMKTGRALDDSSTPEQLARRKYG